MDGPVLPLRLLEAVPVLGGLVGGGLVSGRVGIGEPSVVIAASAPHRAEAFAACREAIETLKTSIPLWKKEVYVGGEEWIGRGS